MDVDKTQRDTAVGRLQNLAGLSANEAEALVDAALAAAIDQTFALVNGSGPVPTTMTASRADRLRFVCARAGRLLSQREVAILFRVTDAAARSILTTMLATYEEDLRTARLVRMQADVKVTKTGTVDDGLTWTLRFTERSTFETAWSELGRLGLQSDAEASVASRTLVIPRQVVVDSTRSDPLKLLGLKAPK